jgi:hypothetical protein
MSWGVAFSGDPWDTLLEVFVGFLSKGSFCKHMLCFKVFFAYGLFWEVCLNNHNLAVELCSCGRPSMKLLGDTLAVDTPARHSCRILFQKKIKLLVHCSAGL